MKLKGIQVIRGLAILFVVMTHLSLIEAKFGEGSPVLPAFLGRGIGGIDFFFTISGLIMVIITSGKFHPGRPALSFFYNRLIRIYPLYWVYSTLALGAFLINPGWVNSAQGNRVDLWASFLLYPSPLLPLLNIGWMLTHLIYFYFVFFIFHWLGRENLLPGALILWALVVTGGQAYFHFDGSGRPWLDLALHPYTLEFITGCGLGIIFRRSSNQGGWFFLTGGLILYLSSLFLLNWFPSPGIVSGWSRVFHFGPPAALILYGLIGLESRGRRFSPSVLVKLGDVSYSIYLSHILILALAGRLWALYPSSGRLNHWASLMIMMGAVVAFGMISYRYLEVPLMSIFRDWGRRLMPRGRLESKIL